MIDSVQEFCQLLLKKRRSDAERNVDTSIKTLSTIEGQQLVIVSCRTQKNDELQQNWMENCKTKILNVKMQKAIFSVTLSIRGQEMRHSEGALLSISLLNVVGQAYEREDLPHGFFNLFASSSSHLSSHVDCVRLSAHLHLHDFDLTPELRIPPCCCAVGPTVRRRSLLGGNS